MGNSMCCCSEPVTLDGEPTLYHFDLHRVVGKGAFGKVRVVEHKTTKQTYALKYIDKARCIRQKAIQNVIEERRLLEEINHPFCVNMRYGFQDDENCFLVLDLMLGGDLRFHLDRRGPIPENIVRFWTAEIACAVEYLHRQRIMHRDIKPDNIMLDAYGHAHLADFNVAMHFSDRRLHTSVAGSMAYMAPEMVEKIGAPAQDRKGYTWCIDWWSLGVTAAELMFKRRPFDGKNTEKMRHSILNDPIRLEGAGPKDPKCSPEGLNALYGFLQRDPARRLGCRAIGVGIEDIRQHPWFASLDAEKLINKQLPSPFTVDLKKLNFDVSHELDEFLSAEKPLKASNRKADIEKLGPELRQLESQFTVYDYKNTLRMAYVRDENATSVDLARPSVSTNCPRHQRTPTSITSRSRDDRSVRSEATAVHSSTSSTRTVGGDRSIRGSPTPAGAQPDRPPLSIPTSTRHR